MAAGLWVFHRNGAPQRVRLPKQGDVLADIRLQSGNRVVGTVTHQDGTPVTNTVVVAKSLDTGTLDSVHFPAGLAVKTDSQGKYELPPLRGMYKIYLSQAARTDHRMTRPYVVADEPPPMVAPVEVAVSGDWGLSGSEDKVVNLQACPTLEVSGTIRWPDGRPVPGCEVRINGGGVQQDEVRTDSEGRYVCVVPQPIDNVVISASGANDKEHKWHFAFPVEEIEADYAGVELINFKRLEASLQNIDWELRMHEFSEVRE